LCQNLELVWHNFFDARSEIILDSFWILAQFFFIAYLEFQMERRMSKEQGREMSKTQQARQ
jgi:hypothetical protein